MEFKSKNKCASWLLCFSITFVGEKYLEKTKTFCVWKTQLGMKSNINFFEEQNFLQL
jgi:hypothetical protein